jgi:hypothetical protein
MMLMEHISSMMLSMEHIFVNAFLEVLAETFEGGKPNLGTHFLDHTKSDGSSNQGFFATLDSLSPVQASSLTSLGLSIAAHTAHSAFHIEATIRSASGDRSPNDWQGSFEPRVVDALEWAAQRQRLKNAHSSIVDLAHNTPVWDQHSATGMMATLAHVTYHLGAVKQILKLAREVV